MMHTDIRCSDDGSRWQRVQYYLAPKEEIEMVLATVKAIFLGGCPADHMSAELEDVLCFSSLRCRVIDDDLGPVG
jgi:hypothetical protein